MLAGQEAAGERAPDEDPDVLVEAERYELPLELSRDQAVVRLQRCVPLDPAAIRDVERLHQMPRRVVGAADVANLARADEVVERPQRLLQVGQRVEAVHLVEVDPVRAEPAEARLASLHEVVPGLPHVVRVRHPS